MSHAANFFNWIYSPQGFSVTVKVKLRREANKKLKQPLEVFCKKKVFLKISQISQENTCVKVSF